MMTLCIRTKCPAGVARLGIQKFFNKYRTTLWSGPGTVSHKGTSTLGMPILCNFFGNLYSYQSLWLTFKHTCHASCRYIGWCRDTNQETQSEQSRQKDTRRSTTYMSESYEDFFLSCKLLKRVREIVKEACCHSQWRCGCGCGCGEWERSRLLHCQPQPHDHHPSEDLYTAGRSAQHHLLFPLSLSLYTPELSFSTEAVCKW